MSHLDLSLFFHSKTSNMCDEMSHLLRNIRSIICIFEKYAKDDGDCSTLSKGELKQLIQTEFADVIVVSAENLGQKEEGDQDGLSRRTVENCKPRVGRDKIWNVDHIEPWLDLIVVCWHLIPPNCVGEPQLSLCQTTRLHSGMASQPNQKMKFTLRSVLQLWVLPARCRESESVSLHNYF